MDQSNEVMGHSDGWLHGWGGEAMWIWTGLGVLLVVLLVVQFAKRAKR